MSSIKKQFKASQKECNECGDKIFGTYYTIDDKVVCEEDYKVKIKGFLLLEFLFSALEKPWEMPKVSRCCGWSDNKDFVRTFPPQLF